MPTEEHTPASSAKRKLWVACNACRFRKVRCDREPRLQQGFAACTNCDASSIECLLTVNPPKKRMGKRMKILQEQMEADQLPAPQPVEASAIAMSPGLSSLLEAADNTAQPSASASTFPDSTTSSDVPIIQNGLFTAFGSSTQDIFQVASLQHRQSTSSSSTESISPANPAFTPKSIQDLSESSSPEAILSHAAFLSSRIVQGSNPRPTKRKNPFDRPSLESSVSNQVGFVGGLLGIASLDKHLLDVCTKAYFDSMGQCIGFIRPEWYWPRYHSYFSRFAGLSDPGSSSADNEQPLSELLLIAVACRGSGASRLANRFELQTDLYDHYRRLIKDRERLVRDGFDALESIILMVEHADSTPAPLVDNMSVQGVFDINPISHQGMIRLTKKFELHLEKPFGTRLEGRDGIRQRILFWTIYVYDAIRSEAGRTLPLLLDEEISLERTMPTAMDNGPLSARLKFRDHFVDLATTCRKVSRRILSDRAQGRGIEPADVLEVLDDLQAWHHSLSPLFAWDWNDMLHITGPTDEEDKIRRTFLIYLFLGQWLTLQYAVQEIGLSTQCDAALKHKMQERLRGEMDVALDRQVLVCDYAALFGIIRLHPGMMQSWTITWASWCMQKMQEIVANEAMGRLESAKADQAFQRYLSAVLCFVNATATCDSTPRTPETVQELMNTLKNVTDARSSLRLSFGAV
ncbi:hypothetical protein PANT_22c00297 [Moesziomyces antarcticus T-34]|uniref:Zn(2)-C6 fungal-type domain-containing protein n=1 Tax=Pseudozyma antarctica (strain T-34) TaxID=1151754 RepID=M9LSK2_PSEA3|nr:hypothetical protein PANT_22c00297 [Moesziomyces antarcticus T-34]